MVVGRVGWVVLGSVAVPLACGGRSVDIGGNSGDGGEAGTVSGGSTFGGTPSGGLSGTGGSSTTGGFATGGVSTGGVSTGGVSTGATSGVPTGGSSTGATGGCDLSGRSVVTADGVMLVPSCDGWLESFANPFGIQGSWYAFGDQYPGPNDSKCTEIGMQDPEACSLVSSPPPPPATGFPQRVPGEMCTTGSTAIILPCAPGVEAPGCPERDYANMTGAGIAFDFNAARAEDGGGRYPWNPEDYGIVGFSFEIDAVPDGFRVEIPIVLTDDEAAAVKPPLPSGSTTDRHPDGNPYWGAGLTYPSSPVVPGVNNVVWTDIRPPRTNYVFEPRRMLGIQFHVSASPVARQSYGFCIKNLTVLIQ